MNVCMFVIAECEVGVCILTMSINTQALESTKSSQLMNIIYENLNFKCPEFYQCLQSTYIIMIFAQDLKETKGCVGHVCECVRV